MSDPFYKLNISNACYLKPIIDVFVHRYSFTHDGISVASIASTSDDKSRVINVSSHIPGSRSYLQINPFSTRPHQNVVWYNNSWLGFLKILNYVPKERENFSAKMSHHLSQLNVAMAHSNYFIFESSNWQHIQRLKITILGTDWQLFRLERIAKCSYFILYTQNIKFYWFAMNIKKFLLPIWWYNRGLFPIGNKYLGSSFWMG